MRPLQRRQDEIRSRRVKRQLARQARLRRQILRYSLLLFLVVAGIAGVTRLPWTLHDRAAQIEICNNHVVTVQQVRDSLSGVIGRPLYSLDPRRLEKQICNLPAVRYAFVRRYALPYPHLQVEVLEEFPWATYCSSPEGPAEGVISETGRFIPLAEFPAVAQPHLRICADRNCKLTPVQISNWSGWVAQIAQQTGRPVDLVDLRQAAAVEARCADLGLRLGTADSGLNRRLNRLASVMPVTATLKNKLEYIDLSLESNVPLKLDKTVSACKPGFDAFNRDNHGAGTDEQIGLPPQM